MQTGYFVWQGFWAWQWNERTQKVYGFVDNRCIKWWGGKRTQKTFQENVNYLKSVVRYDWTDSLTSKRFFNFTSSKTIIQEDITNEKSGVENIQKEIIPVLEDQMEQNAKSLGNDLTIKTVKKLELIKFNSIHIFHTEYQQNSMMAANQFVINTTLYYIFDGKEVISIGLSYTPVNDLEWGKVKEKIVNSLKKNNDR